MTQIINYTLPLGDRISMRENLMHLVINTTSNDLVIMAFFLSGQPN